LAKCVNTYCKEGQYETALIYYSKGVELNLDNAAMYLTGRAHCYKELGQHDQALADFGKAIELDPDIAAYVRKYANTYYKEGQYETALIYFGKAIELDPDNAVRYLYSRAHACKAMGQLDKAIADLNKALELAPDGMTPGGNNIWDSRAKMYEAAGEYQKAAADARKAQELEADMESPKENLAKPGKDPDAEPAKSGAGAETAGIEYAEDDSDDDGEYWLDFVRLHPGAFRCLPEKYRTLNVCLLRYFSFSGFRALFRAMEKRRRRRRWRPVSGSGKR
jgi:tetratricopeptide (TPR) repeat protein